MKKVIRSIKRFLQRFWSEYCWREYPKDILKMPWKEFRAQWSIGTIYVGQKFTCANVGSYYKILKFLSDEDEKKQKNFKIRHYSILLHSFYMILGVGTFTIVILFIAFLTTFDLIVLSGAIFACVYMVIAFRNLLIEPIEIHDFYHITGYASFFGSLYPHSRHMQQHMKSIAQLTSWCRQRCLPQHDLINKIFKKPGQK